MVLLIPHFYLSKKIKELQMKKIIGLIVIAVIASAGLVGCYSKCCGECEQGHCYKDGK
jgi:hypothetical protein